MTDTEARIAELERKLAALAKIVRILDEDYRSHCAHHRKESEILSDGLSQLYKNGHFLSERVYHVFSQVFPNDFKYTAEFERILGKEIGPDEPKKDS